MAQPSELSKRERQIMDAVYQLGRASAADVREALPDAPSDSSVRTFLRILEQKGHLVHEKDGPRFIYLPSTPKEKASKSALSHLVKTFFDGSSAAAAAALLNLNEANLDNADLDRLQSMIDQAKQSDEGGKA